MAYLLTRLRHACLALVHIFWCASRYELVVHDLKSEDIIQDSPYWESSGSMGSPIEIMA